MFYSQLILAKKGPLGQVWLAAHWDKKLTKATITAADVEQAADSIANPVVPLALRVSGHLLLGVTRIYSRKVNYLFTDCSEALVKIKMAFRPGIVDLPEQQVTANPSSINVSSFGEFDTHIPYDIHALVAPSLTEWMTTPSQTQARRQDITLADTSSKRLQDDSFGGQDSFGAEDSFGGGDWQAFDIDSNQELDSSTISDIERGRDADASGIVIPKDNSMLDASMDLQKSVGDEVDMFQDDNIMDVDMNANTEIPDIDMGAGVDEQFEDHGMEAPNSPNNQSASHMSIDFVIEEEPVNPDSNEVQVLPKKQRKRKIGRDSMTELSSSVIKRGLKDVSDIVRVRGPTKRQKLNMSEPSELLSTPSTVCLSSKLLGMFKTTMKNGKLPSVDEPKDEGDEEPVERMRRQSAMEGRSYAEEDELIPDHLNERTTSKDDTDFEFGGGELEPIEADHGIDVDQDIAEEEVERIDHGFDLDLTLAPVNEIKTNFAQEETNQVEKQISTADHKWHPHTVKVLKVLRKSLEDKETVSYKALAKTTRSRRTAAALFFEMLQLKTLDYIQVEQNKPYGNIQISKTSRFMDHVPAVDGE